MTLEEDTDEGELRRKIREEIQLPETGIVTKVYEHANPDDNWNFHADVRISADRHPRKVPVAVSAPDLIAPPRSTSHEEGPDLALIQFMQDSDNERPVITNILYNDVDRPPIGKEGMVRLRRGELYLELEDDGSTARISKKADGEEVPVARIEINDSGVSPVIRMTKGDDAMGVKIDMGSGVIKLADENGKGIRITNDGDIHLHGNVKQHTGDTITL